MPNRTPISSARSRAACRNWIETAYWLELLTEAEIVPADKLKPLMDETNELIAILVTIVTKVKQRSR